MSSACRTLVKSPLLKENPKLQSKRKTLSSYYMSKMGDDSKNKIPTQNS